MKRVTLDSESPAIRKFIGELPMDAAGVELELNGRIICRVVPPSMSPATEKAALIQERWELIRQVQERTHSLSATAIDGQIEQAVDEVRSRNRK